MHRSVIDENDSLKCVELSHGIWRIVMSQSPAGMALTLHCMCDDKVEGKPADTTLTLLLYGAAEHLVSTIVYSVYAEKLKNNDGWPRR